MKKVILSLMVAAAMTSCGADLTSEAADKLCECGNIAIKAQEDAANATSATDLLAASSDATAKAMECMVEAQKKYEGKVDGEKLKAAMKEKCPKFYEMVLSGGN